MKNRKQYLYEVIVVTRCFSESIPMVQVLINDSLDIPISMSIKNLGIIKKVK